MEKFIVADGCALRVRREGSGPAVLLLHGYLESLEIWDGLIPMLKNDFTVVAPDLPGHGVSQVMGEVHSMERLAAVMRGVLDDAGIEKCVLVGHSMGGYVALAFLELFPERVSGIVLLSSTPLADSETRREARMREIEIVEAGKKDVLAGLAAPAGFAPSNRRRMAECIEGLESQASLTDDEGITALLRGMMERPDRSEALRRSPVPKMLIFGRQDPHIAPEQAQAIAESQPGAAVVWLDGSGHMGHVEEPDKVVEALRAFIAPAG